MSAWAIAVEVMVGAPLPLAGVATIAASVWDARPKNKSNSLRVEVGSDAPPRSVNAPPAARAPGSPHFNPWAGRHQ